MKQIDITDASQLGKIIKKRRKAIGSTQKQLADFCNLSHNGISRIEIGESDVKLSTLLKITEMLGVSINIKLEDEL